MFPLLPPLFHNQEFNILKVVPHPGPLTIPSARLKVLSILIYLHHNSIDLPGLQFLKVKMFISEGQEDLDSLAVRLLGPPAKNKIESWPTVLKQERHRALVLWISATGVGH